MRAPFASSLPRFLVCGLVPLLCFNFAGCATLMSEKKDTVRIKTWPAGGTLKYQGRIVADGDYLEVRRQFKPPRIAVVGEEDESIDLEYSPNPWLLGDAGLLLFFVIPGLVAGGVDLATGAWRSLDDIQVIELPSRSVAAALPRAPRAAESRSVTTKKSSPSLKTRPEDEPAKTGNETTPPEARQEEAVPSSDPGWNRTSDVLPAPEEGVVSWYSKPAGNLTASGQAFDPGALTAAHRTLPFGTVAQVTRLDNGQSVEVTINDRGPIAESRLLDLTRAGAEAIGLLELGIAPCRVEVLRLGSP